MTFASAVQFPHLCRRASHNTAFFLRKEENKDLDKLFLMEANDMKREQTAPKRAVCSGSILVAKYAS